MGLNTLNITVAGRPLVLDDFPGDIEMSTCWPGGSDELSWTYGRLPASRYRGGEDVAAYFGPVCVWRGTMLEPDPSQDTLTAQGAWQDAAGVIALSNTGGATTNCDQAIDNAITRGLNWTRPVSIRSATLGSAIDTSQGPVALSALLDTIADVDGLRWGVNTAREVFTKADDTTPTYQTMPLNEGLGFALDNYACTLIGRYLDSGTSTYKTVTVTDTVAQTTHGNKEQTVDLVTGRGAMTAAAASGILTNLLALGAATPQWTASLEFTYGQLFNRGGVPVALETVAAGSVFRVHGGFSLAQRLNGALYVDIPIGRTQLADGTLTITPAQIASRSLADALTAALQK